MRRALYARCSSGLQRAEGIEDLLRLRRARAGRDGWTAARDPRPPAAGARIAAGAASPTRPGWVPPG